MGRNQGNKMSFCLVRRNVLSGNVPLRWLSSGSPAREYDVVVVGGGHNGLVSAAYLAKLGVKTAVFEKRHLIGGAAVAEEIVPNYKFSRASYVLSLLRPQIFTDLELKKHGLKVHLRDPSSYTPIRPDLQSPGGPTSLTLGMCGKMNHQQISQFSERDAAKYVEYEEELEQFVKAVDPLLDHAAVDVQALSEASIFEKIKILKSNMHLLKSAKILDKWFESEPLKATLATDSCIGAMISPETPGSGYVLLHHVMGELEGIRGAWGYPEGGMGAVSGAIAKSAHASGAQIFTSSPVAKITTAISGEANGIVLENGTEVKAKIVLSNATSEITFNSLMKTGVDVPEEFRRSLSTIDYTSPVCKINVALNKIPNFLANPNTSKDSIMPHHRCTIHINCEDSGMIQQAYQDAKDGNYSKKPMIEMTIPSSLDPTLAPDGHHVCLIFTQYAPYHLKTGEWDQAAKEAYAETVFNSIEMYAPGFKESIVGKEVLPPPDLERIFGLTGGNIFHGAMSLDQLYMTRPTAGHVSPATPVGNLLLCGSGAHPGGGVMGAPGRIAAIRTSQILGKNWNF